MLQIAVALASLSMLLEPVYGQVNLGGTIVPKDKIIVFIGIGHSNMAGRADMDDQTNSRCWNYRIDNAEHGWELAKDPIHCEFCNNNVNVCWSKGGPMFQLIKKMALVYPDYHFGVIQNAHSSASLTVDEDNYCDIIGGGTKIYKKGGSLYTEMVSAIKEIKDKVTIGGVFTELGQLDRFYSSAIPRFATDYASMANAMRTDLGIPNLPFYVMQLEAGGTVQYSATNTSGKAMVSQINQIPDLIDNCAIVSTAWSTATGMMEDDHHFSLQGNRRLADEIVNVINSNKFSSWATSAIQPGYIYKSHSNSDNLLLSNAMSPNPFLYGKGEYALYSVTGKQLSVFNLSETSSTYQLNFGKGVYIVKSRGAQGIAGRGQIIIVK
jgi:hypothetical protein